MIDQSDMTHGWLVLSAMAAAITALAQMRYKEMTWADIGFALFSGFGFAVFFMPWVAIKMGIAPSDIRATNAIVYIGGTGWNILMPFAIMKLRQAFPMSGEDKA